MAKYSITTNGGVFDTELEIFIPPDTNNSDWNKYITWLGLGNVPDPLITETTQYPEVYANLYFTDGDSRIPPGINLDGPLVERHLVINGDLRMYKDIPQSVITVFGSSEVPEKYRVTVRKVVSEQEDSPVDSYSIVIGFEYGIITHVNEDTSREYYNYNPGVYCISEDDFIILPFYGTDYKIRLVNNPVYFKVYP